MTAREIATAAFYADSHPLLDKYVAANGIDPEREGYGVDLSELIAFAELQEREACAHLADIQAGLEGLHYNDENAKTAEIIARSIRARTNLIANR